MQQRLFLLAVLTLSLALNAFQLAKLHRLADELKEREVERHPANKVGKGGHRYGLA